MSRARSPCKYAAHKLPNYSLRFSSINTHKPHLHQHVIHVYVVTCYFSGCHCRHAPFDGIIIIIILTIAIISCTERIVPFVVSNYVRRETSDSRTLRERVYVGVWLLACDCGRVHVSLQITRRRLGYILSVTFLTKSPTHADR